ncbi:MAG TPA: neuraminidase-like domain-containing protein, partial [Longimicrobiaceae bacterium]|nr:neuraminidase-like domain-containing protein [Longimicrobiaceae bacterium]
MADNDITRSQPTSGDPGTGEESVVDAADARAGSEAAEETPPVLMPIEPFGGGGEPPSLIMYIASASVREGWVKPGSQVTIDLSGTVRLEDDPEWPAYNVSESVTAYIGGGTYAASIAADGTWSATGTAVVTGSGEVQVQVSADGIARYSDSPWGSPTNTATASDLTWARARVDGTGPAVAPTLPDGSTYDAPPRGSTRPVRVTGTASDTQSGLASLAVGLSTTSLSSVTVAGSGQWDTSVQLPSQPGVHLIHVRGRDTLGNETWKQLSATLVDRFEPQVTLDTPPDQVYDDALVTIPVSGTVVDAHSSVGRVKVTLTGHDGTVLVANQPATLLDPHGPGQTSRWSTGLRNVAPGDYTVSVLAEDSVSPPNVTAAAKTAQVGVNAIPLPTVRITSHRNGDVVPGSEEGARVTLRGEAGAELSTLQRVQVRVGNDWANEDDGFVDAVPEVENNWSKWRAEVDIPPQGSHMVLVRAVNTARNPAVQKGHASVTLSVGVVYRPQDGDDSTTLGVYFRDLRDYVLRRVEVTADGQTRDLTAAALTRDFFQAFDPLRPDEPVAQVRICIEVLRGYLASMQGSVDPAREAEYRETAYRALLVQFGTSYEELRASRSASPQEREALAERLGIPVAHLGELFLAPAQITEPALESLFGLRDTDPATPAAPGLPQLFRWQSEFLRAAWRRQDQPAPGGAPTPVIDPDLVGEQNIPQGKRGKSNPFYVLLTERAAWLRGLLQALAADVRAGEADQARLARLVGQAIAPASMADLLAREHERIDGVDVVPALAALGLTLPAFRFLVRLHAAAGHGELLPTEWDEVYSLLAGIEKRRRYAQWRAEEGTLVLGPDEFQVTIEQPEIPAWRATAEEWRAWQSGLQARIDHQETVRRGYHDAVDAAEAASLPLLRDALVDAIGAGAGEGVDVANWLTQRLMVDVKASSALRTTRATQAIETLQAILSALRAGRFMEMDTVLGPPPVGSWDLFILGVPEDQVGEKFDQEWAWMGTFTSWRAAMRVFLYPENLLVPGLRLHVTPEFRTMLAAGSGSRLSAKGARDMAEVYLEELQENTEVWDGLAALNAAWREQTFALDERIAEAHLPGRAAAIEAMMVANNRSQPVHRYLEELFFWVPVQLGLLLHRSGQFTAALDWFRTVYGYNLPAGERKVYFGLKREESNPCVYQTTDQWLRTTLNPHDIAPDRAGAFTRFTLLSIARCFTDYADAEFANESGEATARARTLYLAALELLGSPDMRLPGGGDDPAVAFGFPPNPEAVALRMHGELNLFKLRNGRNIAGMQRHAARGQDAASPAPVQPTPYRYQALVDRAKQLVDVAQQMEAQYLAALEKRDAETYNLIRARHDLSLTQATVHLQDLRIGEAVGGVSLAGLQQSRASVQRSTYRKWIDGGPIQAERDLLQNYRDINEARNWTAGLDAAITAAQALNSAASGGLFGSGLGGGLPIAGGVGVMSVARASLVQKTNDLEAKSQANSFRASYERRMQEWQLQASLAEKDETIGAQQVVQAEHHLRIVTQERTIAQMQANNAHAMVEFLASKFTNAELYEWMSGVLGRVYSYFLQQATVIARLAEAQLAFERQEKP